MYLFAIFCVFEISRIFQTTRCMFGDKTMRKKLAVRKSVAVFWNYTEAEDTTGLLIAPQRTPILQKNRLFNIIHFTRVCTLLLSLFACFIMILWL